MEYVLRLTKKALLEQNYSFFNYKTKIICFKKVFTSYGIKCFLKNIYIYRKIPRRIVELIEVRSIEL
jgi:hypothetical protein